MKADATSTIPGPVLLVHLFFLAGIVAFAHHPAVFMGLFLFFMGFAGAYPKYQEQSDCKKDVDALSEMCRGQRPLSQGVPLSLLTVCDEYKRLGL